MVVKGAYYEILVAGKTISYRDQKEVALEAAKYLKARNPGSPVEVRDRRTGETTPVASF